ncbi:5'-nucleotidase SurE [Ananas comosus]|uniref:5'-nucleotidase SurE n=1 Tax=Ananas comosus TaxID=4615 RepID=A0A199USI5_ANACO|nr:5'-nucleotidase SurE [Ananas comosus]
MTTTPDSGRSNHLPASLVANLQSVLIGRGRSGGGDGEETGETKPTPSSEAEAEVEEETGAPSNAAEATVAESDPAGDGSEKVEKPVVLVTNADGIGSPGLTSLVEALVRGGQCDVSVCAPESNKSASAHSVTIRETLAVTSVEITGAKAFEVTGTPADCVSLALSGALFSWSRPALVISGINSGSVCGHQIFYSGAVAGAREALMHGIPSLCISLHWKKDESQESDFKDAVDICMPLIQAAIRDIEKGSFPRSCILNIGIPRFPSANKGFKLTRQSLWKLTPNWQAITANRNPSAAHFMSMHQSLGVQLAQLEGCFCSWSSTSHKCSKENCGSRICGSSWKTRDSRSREEVLPFLDKQQEDLDEDLDFRALEDGFITVTPLHIQLDVVPEIQALASAWLDSALTGEKEAQ